ncbi:MAG: histidine kinase dimerization/phospho-acceptor domain-containing protein [Gemmatimonadota bacterium]
MTPPSAQLLIGTLVLTILVLSVFAGVTVVRHAGCARTKAALLARLLPSLQPHLYYRWDLQTSRVIRDISLVERLGFGSAVCASSWQEWAELIVPEDRGAFEDAMTAVEARKLDRYLLEYGIRIQGGDVLRVVDQGIAEFTEDGGRRVVISGTLGVLDDPRGRDSVTEVPLTATVTTSLPHEADQALFGRAGGVLFASSGLSQYMLDDLDDSRFVGPRTLRAATAGDMRCLEDLWRQAERRGIARRRVWLSTADRHTRLMDLTLISVKSEFARSEMLLEVRDVTDAHTEESGQAGLQRFELVSRFARRFAHDVRSPLGTIRNFAELIRRSEEEPDARERYVTQIARAVDEITAATRELGRVAEANENTATGSNLAVVLEDVVAEFSAEYGVYGSSITIPQDARQIAIPDTAMRVVARSLLREVYEATMGEGGVHVMATRVDDDVVIRVESDDALLPAHTGTPTPDGRVLAPRESNARRIRVASEVLSVFGATLVMSRTPTGGTLFEVRCPAASPVEEVS